MSKSSSLTNVLVVSGGGFQGLALLKGLLQHGDIRIVLADCYDENVGRYFVHRAVKVPPVGQTKRFIAALLRICHTEDIDVIFPSTAIELRALAEHARTFAQQGARVAVSTLEFLETVGDKEKLYAFLRTEGLPVPVAVNVASSRVQFPILGKPKKGWGGTGQVVLRSVADRRKHSLSDLQRDYTWQPFLSDFTEYSIDFAINFRGQVSERSIRERVRVSGGFAVVARQSHNRRVAAIAAQFANIAARRGGRGVLNVQIIQSRDACFISDVNARIGTSAPFAYAAGLDLPAFVWATHARKTAPAKPVTMVRYLEELFVRDARLERVRAVVFDLDDTLMSQKWWILEKLRGLYPHFSQRLPPRDTFLAQAITIVEEGNRAKLIDGLCDTFRLSPTLGQELIAAYRSVRPKRCHIFTDVRPTLDELGRRGYRLAILTNNPPASQRQKIAVCGFQKDFDEIVFAAEHNFEKPSKEGFRYVAKQLKIPAHSMVMVGDNLYSDITAGLRAGYQHGFFLLRRGGFFNFDLDIFNELSGGDDRCTPIGSLRDLLWHLPPR